MFSTCHLLREEREGEGEEEGEERDRGGEGICVF
jgi:hypothetical protein